MENVLYIVLGIFDAMSVILISMKLFRMPIWEFKWKILLTAVGISLVSYLNRIVLNTPSIDMPLQLIVFVVSLRYLLKFRIFEAVLIIVTGIMVYSPVQYLIYLIFLATGIMNSSVVTHNSGLSVYLIQISTILLIYLISFIFYRFNLGFAFIIVPPHDPHEHIDYFSKENRKFIIAIVLGVMFISLDLVLLFEDYIYLLFPAALVISGTLYFLSHWRNLHD